MIKPPAWVEASRKHSHQFAQQARTYPELVREFRRFFIERISLERRAGESAGSIIIGIDELDKISSPDEAERFLNDIKGVFGITNAHYIVSISEDALAAFDRRAFALRTAFDSAFDMVIAVPRMTAGEVRRLLARRLLVLPEPFVILCHSLAAGLPRDVIRIARNLLDTYQAALDRLGREQRTRIAPDAGPATELRVSLAELAAALIQKNDLHANTDGQIAGLSRLHCTGSDAALSWVGDARITPVNAAVLLRLCATPPNLDNDRPAADSTVVDADTITAARMVRQHRAYLYYVATLIDVFCADEAWTFGTDFPTEDLARARSHLAVDHHRSWTMIDAFRSRWGLELVSDSSPTQP